MIFDFDAFSNQRFAISKNNDEAFWHLAYQLFELHSTYNPIYSQYVSLCGVDVRSNDSYPFLPISFFKTHKILFPSMDSEITFTSSATTSTEVSRHHIPFTSAYKENLLANFLHFYGDFKQYSFYFLLPSYLERSGSSLIWMCRELALAAEQNVDASFYLNDYEGLLSQVEIDKGKGKTPFIIGVTFALLEMASLHSQDLSHAIMMETGGMKGRGPELTRYEVHDKMKAAFAVNKVHSEYGMTELMSQAYSLGDGIFECPPWMRILIRDPEDPFQILPVGKRGAIQIIDLANMYSCPFIATDDLGQLHEDGTFEVLGRLDHAAIRGCNLMIMQD